MKQCYLDKTPECASMQLKVESGEAMSTLGPNTATSLEEIWSGLDPTPAGVLNQLDNPETDAALTATIFLPMQCRLVCGREDGSIILVSFYYYKKIIKKFVKLCLHLSIIVQNNFQFDEIFFTENSN